MSDPKYITYSFSVSVDEAAELMDAIDEIAEREGARSRSRVIVRALRFFLIHHSTPASIPHAEVAEVTE